MYQVKFSEQGAASKVQQIVSAFVKDINHRVFEMGVRLPSINEFSEINGVSRDTIEKAYRRLKISGYIASSPGRGYYVLNRSFTKMKVLLVFNKLSSIKGIIYESLQKNLGDDAQIDVSIHHGDPNLLKEILESNLGKYNYYVVVPHFNHDANLEECRRVLQIIPQYALIVLDKYLNVWGRRTMLVYQDFKSYIYNALSRKSRLLNKYRNMSLVSQGKFHYPKELVDGITHFCLENNIRFKLIGKLEKEALRRECVYIVDEEEDLARLIKKLRQTSFVLGKDVGIISFTESATKELLDITVFTTDFEAMGRTTADIILGKVKPASRNPFYTICRGSL